MTLSIIITTTGEHTYTQLLPHHSNGLCHPVCGQVILAVGDYMNVQCHSCIGGTSIGEDIRKLDFGQHVVSGTPGRLFGLYTTVWVIFKTFVCVSFSQLTSSMAFMCIDTYQSDIHHCFKCGNIPKTVGGQVYLIFTTDL